MTIIRFLHFWVFFADLLLLGQTAGHRVSEELLRQVLVLVTRPFVINLKRHHIDPVMHWSTVHKVVPSQAHLSTLLHSLSVEQISKKHSVQGSPNISVNINIVPLPECPRSRDRQLYGVRSGWRRLGHRYRRWLSCSDLPEDSGVGTRIPHHHRRTPHIRAIDRIHENHRDLLRHLQQTEVSDVRPNSAGWADLDSFHRGVSPSEWTRPRQWPIQARLYGRHRRPVGRSRTETVGAR